MQNHRQEFKITLMCRILNVSKTQYYAWLKRVDSSREKENKVLKVHIMSLFERSKRTYGTRRLKKALSHLGFIVSRRRIRYLMQELGLRCKTKKRFKATTDSNHNYPVSPNLLNRKFTVHRPDTHYVGDITYIPTDQGWLYLAVVIDLYSRKVVGWAMSNRMKAALVNDALLMALWSRKPKRGLLWHTDRGSQYCSDSHRKIIKAHGIKQSMSRKGNCWDNSVAESFFHSLKTELVYQNKFNTREQARREIFRYISVFYNRQRLHSTNGYLSPDQYESLMKSA